MKTIMVLLALGCVACAATDPVVGENIYHPPVYRTGSNIPAQGSSETSSSTDAGQEEVRQALPPPIVRKPTNG